jgi:Fe-S-cluster-containing dehydrogenase component
VTVCDKKRCIGCLMCYIACPFGVIEEGDEGSEQYSISKCDLCVSIGEAPACVNACPTKALVFEEPDNFSKNKRIKYLVELSSEGEV